MALVDMFANKMVSFKSSPVWNIANRAKSLAPKAFAVYILIISRVASLFKRVFIIIIQMYVLINRRMGIHLRRVYMKSNCTNCVALYGAAAWNMKSTEIRKVFLR